MRYCFGCTSLARRRGKDKEKQNRKNGNRAVSAVLTGLQKPKLLYLFFDHKRENRAVIRFRSFSRSLPLALKLPDMTGRREVRIVPSTFATLFYGSAWQHRNAAGHCTTWRIAPTCRNGSGDIRHDIGRKRPACAALCQSQARTRQFACRTR